MKVKNITIILHTLILLSCYNFNIKKNKNICINKIINKSTYQDTIIDHLLRKEISNNIINYTDWHISNMTNSDIILNIYVKNINFKQGFTDKNGNSEKNILEILFDIEILNNIKKNKKILKNIVITEIFDKLEMINVNMYIKIINKLFIKIIDNIDVN